jgi:hypothetical protein
MRLSDWADQVVYDLDKYGSFGKLIDENDWQDWAANISNNTSIGINTPNPYDFKDWSEWAELLCKTTGS